MSSDYPNQPIIPQIEEEVDPIKLSKEELVRGFSAFDDRMKLNDPMWSQITRVAYMKKMPEIDRIKMLATNFAMRAMMAEKQVHELLSQNPFIKIEDLEVQENGNQDAPQA